MSQRQQLIVPCVVSLLASVAIFDAEAATKADLSLPDPRVADPALALDSSESDVAAAMAHYLLAQEHLQEGRLRSALPHLTKSAMLDPRHLSLVAQCAELVMQYESREAAVQLLKDNLARCPDEPGAHFNLIRFLSTYVSEDPFTRDDSLALVEDMLGRFPANSEVLVFAVLHHLSMNQRPKAAALLEGCLQRELHWNQSKPWMELARVAQEVWPLGQPDELEKHAAKIQPFLDRALALAPDSAIGDEIRLEVARQYLLSNQLSQARALCESMQRTRNPLPAAKMLHSLLLSAGEKDEALQLLENMVQRQPDDVMLRKNLAQTHEQRGDLAKAIAHLEKVIQRAGGDPETYQTLGQWLLRDRQYRKAIDLSLRSIRLYPQEPGFRLQASFAWSAQGRWNEALSHLAAAAAMAENGQPDLLNHRFYRHYGITLASAGKRDQAARMLEKAITLTPKDETDDAANTMNYLGYLYLEDNQHLAKAGELITKANELKPDQAAYIDSLGWWHFKSGNPKQALVELRRAHGLLNPPQGEDAEIFEHLAEVEAALGGKAQARQWLQSALALPGLDAEAAARIRRQLDQQAGQP